MKIKLIALLLASHIAIGFLGFALGIYTLPILIAPDSPSNTEIRAMTENARYSTSFKKDLAGSDGLHWGEGAVTVSHDLITLTGELAPGPDYKLYLSPAFVDDEATFNALKADMVRVGDVKTFDNFSVTVPAAIDVDSYNTVVVWCETFGEFITSAKYR